MPSPLSRAENDRQQAEADRIATRARIDADPEVRRTRAATAELLERAQRTGRDDLISESRIAVALAEDGSPDSIRAANERRDSLTGQILQWHRERSIDLDRQITLLKVQHEESISEISPPAAPGDRGGRMIRTYARLSALKSKPRVP